MWKSQGLQAAASQREELRPVNASDWPTIEILFGNKGACGGCWCMYWRVERGGRTWDAVRGTLARTQIRELTEASALHGILAFVSGAPVGWASTGPYDDFPRLRRVRALQRERPPGVWSVTCFYILPRFRRRGLGTRLLHACVELARAKGARVIEGYPVAVRGSMPDAFVWTGVPAMFAEIGFRPLDNLRNGRQIWVYMCDSQVGR